MVPRENENNAYANFRETNKQYYGIYRNGLLMCVLQVLSDLATFRNGKNCKSFYN